MKKIQIRSIIIPAVALLVLGSCKKSFVEVTPEGSFITSTYYSDASQAYGALVGAYDATRKNSGGFENMITFFNAGSDEMIAGGGGATDGQGIHDFDDYQLSSLSMPASYWNDHYQGVFRVNSLLSRIPNTVMDAGLKERFIGEAKCVRALCYFNLVRMFKNIPLILDVLLSSNMYDVTQSTPEEVYAQIEKDLTEAIPALPVKIPSTSVEAGRFTQGGAKALLGKVYLFENKKDLAAAQFAEVNGNLSPSASDNQYGYALLPDFGQLWFTSSKFNSESILEVSHSRQVALGDWSLWGSGRDESNTVNQMVGPRTYSRPTGSTAPDLKSGWSFNPFTQDFYDFMATDPRFEATVFDMKGLETAGQASYVPGYDNTGYFLNKYIGRSGDAATVGSVELNWAQGSYIIRLADTYLMEAEALGGSGARAQALLDAVRGRVGLPSVPVSLAAIKNERRLEFAGEGIRWFDIIRWGDGSSVLGFKGFVAGKNEIFPIPADELKGTKLVQNPGYN